MLVTAVVILAGLEVLNPVVMAFLGAIAAALGLATWRALLRLIALTKRKREQRRAKRQMVEDSRITKYVVEQIHAELKPNGGNSAFDHLTNALGAVREELKNLTDRIGALEDRQNGDDARTRGLPVPPPPPPELRP